MVRPAGFEPATYGFVVRRSIRAELRAQIKLKFDRFLRYTFIYVNDNFTKALKNAPFRGSGLNPINYAR